MAIINNGGHFDKLSKALIPAGFTPPVSTRTTFPEYCRKEVLIVPKASVENLNKLTTFQNIITDVSVGVDAQVEQIVTDDYIATNNVEYDYDIEQISINVLPSTSSEFYTNIPEAYLVRVSINIKTD